MKKNNHIKANSQTHFLTLDFHPGDLVWAIRAEEDKAFAINIEIIRVIYSITKKEIKEDKANPAKTYLPQYVKEIFYQLADGTSIIQPLRTKEEAEDLIRKGNQVVEDLQNNRIQKAE